MSYSNKAIVFYGYCWDSEDDDDDHDLRRAFLSTAGRFDEIDKLDDFDLEPTEVEWPEMLARSRGHSNPWDHFQPCQPNERDADCEARTEAWLDEHGAEVDAWHALLRDLVSESGVALDYHGVLDSTKPHLLAIGSEIDVCGWDAVELLQRHADPKWRENLDRWLAEFGIEPPQPEPRWWLVASYG